MLRDLRTGLELLQSLDLTIHSIQASDRLKKSMRGASVRKKLLRIRGESLLLSHKDDASSICVQRVFKSQRKNGT